MPDRLSLLVLIAMSALCGALVHELFITRRAASKLAPVQAAAADATRQTERYSKLIDADRSALVAARSRNDSLIHDRLQLRAVLATQHPSDPVTPTPHGRAPAPMHPAHLLRVDDRLLAELLLERRRTLELEAGYQDLIESYRLQTELVNRQAVLERQRFRRRQRRTIVTAVVLSAAVTLVLSGR